MEKFTQKTQKRHNTNSETQYFHLHYVINFRKSIYGFEKKLFVCLQNQPRKKMPNLLIFHKFECHSHNWNS